MERDVFSQLIEAAAAKAADETPALSADFEGRVMMRVARVAIEHSRRRAKMGLVASISGLAMLVAACIAVIVAWLPGAVLMPDGAGLIEKLGLGELGSRISDSVYRTASQAADALPLIEQWGGMFALLFLVGGVAGFVWCLGGLFSSRSRINENL